MSDDSTVLARYLDELGWSPRQLASRINAIFGAGTVSATAAYYWRRAGNAPRAPLPAMIAIVFSQSLGRTITVEELWNGQAVDSPHIVPAAPDMDVPWTLSGTVQLVEDWVQGGLMDRRTFVAASGAALTAAAHAYLELPRLTAALRGDTVSGTLISQIEATLPELRDVDHRRGGLHAKTYVHGQWLTIGALVRDGHHQNAISKRLLSALGEMGDLAGYMAFDAGEHGLAQRYWITALRAAQHAENTALAASILSNMSYQAATREHGRDAVELANAATRAARTAPAAVRASVASRLATAHAAAGEVQAFRAARDRAQDTLAEASPAAQPVPDWASFVSRSYLSSQSACALIQLGRTQMSENRRVARALLEEGQTLLAPSMSSTPSGFQRSGVLRTVWLALGYTASGELEEACLAGRVAAQRLSDVESPRCASLLTDLRKALARGRHQNAAVREFIADLDQVLGQT
ncbi:hypothetical protein STBA_39850 [Streptomyces sp. MP131-18]|nr:hypothetical protein STBA_39850 [Streptomyces sp. MP131-18]